MLTEQFDLIECLRLGAAANENSGARLTKDMVFGELAFLHGMASIWAGLLLGRVEMERIAIITPSEAHYEHRRSVYDWQYEWDRFVSVTPGKVEFVNGPARSADYYRIRNYIAGCIDEQMKKDKFQTANHHGMVIKVAKGIAEVVLKGHIFGKGMCPHCVGVGKFESFEKHKQVGVKRCDKCDGSGKLPFTINEKIKIAGLNVSKSGYSERYQKYEIIGESLIAGWNNRIRDRLARSFYYKEKNVEA